MKNELKNSQYGEGEQKIVTGDVVEIDKIIE